MDETTIKNMYNEGAVAFKKYVTTRNIAQFSDDAAEICKRYDHSIAVCNLMLWWSARAQGLHDEYLGGVNSGRN